MSMASSSRGVAVVDGVAAAVLLRAFFFGGIVAEGGSPKFEQQISGYEVKSE